MRACKPLRARTKGKVESGVKYVKGSAVANLSFLNFFALQAHLADWLVLADHRAHGTTKKKPMELFNVDEKAALRPLPEKPIPRHIRRLRRRVANDALVNIDTIRYSVPHRYVGEMVKDATHYHGLMRAELSVDPPGNALQVSPPEKDESLSAMGRTLRDYAEAAGDAS